LTGKAQIRPRVESTGLRTHDLGRRGGLGRYGYALGGLRVRSGLVLGGLLTRFRNFFLFLYFCLLLA
jgi:hypothetical protein